MSDRRGASAAFRQAANPRHGFPFRRPWHRDGMFWYAIAVGLLTYLALAVMGTGLLGIEGYTVLRFLANVVIGVSLSFVGLVLPVALVRHFIARRQPRDR